MRYSFALLGALAASLVPDVATANRCLGPPREATISLELVAVDLDGVPVTALEPWRNLVRAMEVGDSNSAWLRGEEPYNVQEFVRVP